jgi:hypothetical protein
MVRIGAFLQRQGTRVSQAALAAQLFVAVDLGSEAWVYTDLSGIDNNHGPKAARDSV